MRSLFPIFDHHPNLVYLDSAASTQKPRSVIAAEMDFYSRSYANVHRGVYGLSSAATTAFEAVRVQVQQFLNAPFSKEIIFTSGTTEGVNLVAFGFLSNTLKENDQIIVSAMEHHGNLIPYQQVCFSKKAQLKVIPMDENGVLDLEKYADLLRGGKTPFVAVTHVSNTLGTVNPIKKIIELAHQHGAYVLIDAAQSVSSFDLDVQKLDADFLVFSAHKLFGPTGVGILYGKADLLNQTTPYRFGGGGIRDVRFEKTIFAPIPQKLEAGTPNIAGVIGLGAAIDFVEKTGRNTIKAHVDKLLSTATEALLKIDGIEIIGNAPEKSAILSFILRGVHPHDIASILAAEDIAVRAGHHCTQPIMDFLDLPATVRASFSIYNNLEDVERLVLGLEKVKTILIEF